MDSCILSFGWILKRVRILANSFAAGYPIFTHTGSACHTYQPTDRHSPANENICTAHRYGIISGWSIDFS
jgi:hypothetical protein